MLGLFCPAGPELFCAIFALFAALPAATELFSVVLGLFEERFFCSSGRVGLVFRLNCNCPLVSPCE